MISSPHQPEEESSESWPSAADELPPRPTHTEALQALAEQVSDLRVLLDEVLTRAALQTILTNDQGLAAAQPNWPVRDKLQDALDGKEPTWQRDEIQTAVETYGTMPGVGATLFADHVFGDGHLPAAALLALYEQDGIKGEPAAAILKDSLRRGLQQELDPLVRAALSRPADFLDSLARLWRVLAEVRNLADVSGDESLKLALALRHGLPERSGFSEQAAPAEMLRQLGATVEDMLSRDSQENWERELELEVKIDARSMRLVSNPDASYPGVICVKKPVPGSRQANWRPPDWRYCITYAMRDRHLSQDIYLTGEGEAGLAGIIKAGAADREKGWRRLSYQEGARIQADLDDLCAVLDGSSLALLLAAEIDHG